MKAWGSKSPKADNQLDSNVALKWNSTDPPDQEKMTQAARRKGEVFMRRV